MFAGIGQCTLCCFSHNFTFRDRAATPPLMHHGRGIWTCAWLFLVQTTGLPFKSMVGMRLMFVSGHKHTMPCGECREISGAEWIGPRACEDGAISAPFCAILMEIWCSVEGTAGMG